MLLLVALALSANPEEYLVFSNGDYGSKFYRIPAIVTAKDGSLVTATDQRWDRISDLPGKISVVIKRSTDDGKTWSEPITIAADSKGYGDASLVVDQKTGAIFCLFNGLQGIFSSTYDDPVRLFFCRSDDNGETWTQPADITHFIYGKNCTDPTRNKWKGMFISSGAAMQMRDGRIMAVGVAQRVAGSSLSNYPVYTDDLGETWNVGGLAGNDGGDESKVIELNNGSVLMSIRHAPYRLFAVSNDRGETWQSSGYMYDIHDPACNGDIVRYTSTKDGYDKDRIIHTIPYSRTRANVSVLISYDEGNTWPVKKVIQQNGAAYSSVAITADGHIAVYYERAAEGGWDLVAQVMDLEWVTDGDDKWTPAT